VTGDLRDLAGRAQRLLLSLAVGIAMGAVGWRCSAMLHLGNDDTGMRGWGLFWFALTAGAAVFAITLAELNRRARKRWQASRLPRAQILHAAPRH